MKRLIVALCIALAGCASGMVPVSSDAPPDNWPLLRVSYWFGTPAAVVQACYDAVPGWAKPLGGVAMGCAYINFKAQTCGINVMYGDYATLGHEQDHCYGKGHIDSSMQEQWTSFLHGEFDAMPRLKAYYYKRALDGSMVQVTRDANRSLHFKVQ